MRHLIRQFLRLSSPECWLFLQVIVVLPLSILGLRWFGFRRWYAYLAFSVDRLRRLPPPEHAALQARQSWQWVQSVSRYGLHPGNCLSRSLSLWWVLRRQGIEAALRIGVQRADGQFRAHAWLEYQGHPLNARPDVHDRFAAFQPAIKPDMPDMLKQMD